MGTRGFGGTFLVAVFPLLLSSPYHKPRLKKLSSKVEGGRDLQSFMSRKKSVEYVAPKRQEGPIPTGWNLEIEVQKDGSKTSFYHCPDTGQHFYTYADLIRYVDYAKRKGLGIYSLCSKSVKKRETNVENNCTATKARKTSAALSIRRRPSNSNSLNVDQSSDSKSSTSSESTDKEKDEDYVPEPNGDVSTDLGVDHDRELNEMRRSKQPK